MKIVVGILISWFLTIGCMAATESITFFQASSKANILKLHGNNYILTFTNQPVYINYFTKTNAGALSLSKFLTLWKTHGNFFDHPPHAMLGIINRRHELSHASVLVTNPSYDNGTITYQIATGKIPLTPGATKHLVLIFDTTSLNLDDLQ